MDSKIVIRENFHENFRQLRRSIGEHIANKIGYDLYKRYCDREKENSFDIENFDFNHTLSKDTVRLQSVTVLAEDIRKFSDGEARIRSILKEKLRMIKEDTIHNLFKDYDKEYDRNNFKDYTLKLTELKPSLEIMKQIREIDATIPEIRGVNMSISLPPAIKPSNVFKDFFKSIPNSIQYFKIKIDDKIVGWEEILPKVTKRFSIVDSQIEGSLIKTVLSKSESLKEIEFKNGNIRKLDTSFKLEKTNYEIEELTFNRCHFNSSYKHMKSCLTNLIIAMSKRSYKNTLKWLKLKVTEDADLEEEAIQEIIEEHEMKCKVKLELI